MISGLLRTLSPRRARLREREKLQRAGIVTVGRSTYGDFAVKTFGGDQTTLAIGNYCSIAGGVTFILGGNHPLDRISTFPFREMLDLPGKWTDGFPSSRGPIVVGSDVWIGTGATILSGVTIGHGAVIAAGSIVTRDVPPYTIAAGAPARGIRSRLPDHLVRSLLDIRWWDWSPDKVKKASHLLNDRIAPEEAIDGLRNISS